MGNMFGFLNVWKPRGMSSYDVIRHVKRCVGRGVKLGHAGTLDPLAEGVLVVCVGPATRLAEAIHAYDKEYLAVIRLGAVSSTDDAEGRIDVQPVSAEPDDRQIRDVLKKFVGAIDQVPPAHSAVKVAGKRAYQLARRGCAPDLAAKRVVISALDLLDYTWPEARVRVRCGTGTYIRALARDVGAALGVGGYCGDLVRERVGPFRADAAVALERITAEGVEGLLLPAVLALPAGARVGVTDAESAELLRGRAIPAADLPAGAADQAWLGAVDPQGRLIALVQLDPAGATLRPEKTFPVEEAPE